MKKFSFNLFANHGIIVFFSSVASYQAMTGNLFSLAATLSFCVAAMIGSYRSADMTRRHNWDLFRTALLAGVLGVVLSQNDGRGAFSVLLLLFMHIGNPSMYKKSGSLPKPSM
jgi:hypothetical protein